MEEQILFTNGNTTVCKFYYQPINNYAVRKLIHYSSSECTPVKAVREINTLQILDRNPNCIRIYDHRESSSNGVNSIEIITEYCERSNLLDYGRILSSNNQRLDKMLIYYLKKSIKFFRFLQENGLAHRDIKPENVFVTQEDDLKFGDFGTSISCFSKSNFSIQGSPYFLSPELRTGWHDYNTTGVSLVEHSPIKSDVYSLGLVFLYMDSLEEINDEFQELDRLEEVIPKYLNRVRNNVVREFAEKMLRISCEDRPDFVQLDEEIENKKIFQCFICKVSEFLKDLSCTQCYRDYHYQCLGSNVCPYCNVSMRFLTEHVFTVDIKLYPLKFRCFQCGNLCEMKCDKYFCKKCNYKFCIKCKRLSHVSNCLKLPKGKVLMCNVCLQVVKEYYFKDIFYFCKCGYRCVVCMKGLDQPHMNCCFMLSSDC